MPDELTDFKLDTDKFGESYRNLIGRIPEHVGTKVGPIYRYPS